MGAYRPSPRDPHVYQGSSRGKLSPPGSFDTTAQFIRDKDAYKLILMTKMDCFKVGRDGNRGGLPAPDYLGSRAPGLREVLKFYPNLVCFCGRSMSPSRFSSQLEPAG